MEESVSCLMSKDDCVLGRTFSSTDPTGLCAAVEERSHEA